MPETSLFNSVGHLLNCTQTLGDTVSLKFKRDAAISILNCEKINGEIILDLEIVSNDQLLIKAGMPISIYEGNPEISGSSLLTSTVVPCTISPKSSDQFQVRLPINYSGEIYVSLNDYGQQTPPISFPLTNILESDYTNNITKLVSCGPPVELSCEQLDSGLKIYPNPFMTHLQFELPFYEEPISIKIVNTKGQVIYQTELNWNTLNLELSQLRAGVYIVIFGSDCEVLRKVVKAG